jgi:hypothetical protein
MESQKSVEEEAEKGFSISDKRLFTKEGQRRPRAEQAEPSRVSAPPPPRQETPPRESAQQTGTQAREAPPRDMPPADFSTFVMMLANNVMVFLGQIPDPVSQQRRRDLLQAKHTIDLLLMLREKTKGNLNPQEETLLQELLPQLQMAYVSSSRQVG